MIILTDYLTWPFAQLIHWRNRRNVAVVVLTSDLDRGFRYSNSICNQEQIERMQYSFLRGLLSHNHFSWHPYTHI